MKKIIPALLALIILLLCGCTAAPEQTAPPTESTAPVQTELPTETTAPATEEVTEPSTEGPTEPPVPANPLTGEPLEKPLESRIFAVSINNVAPAMPMYGVSQADLFFEMFVNDHCTRGLALYADITEAEAIGSVRSLRFNFTDICQAYDAIVVHASGSKKVLKDLSRSGVPNLSAEVDYGDYHFRDQDRIRAGYAWEHCLFVRGAELAAYAAEAKGYSVTQPADKTYGLHFAEDGTPAGGEDASSITIRLTHDSVTKNSTMNYREKLGKYLFSQYGQEMIDGSTGEPVAFENVIVMYCVVENQGIYHVAELEGSGEGYFACGGKIVPIVWSRGEETEPFTFTLTDGTPLCLGIGSTYIAVAPMASTVEYQ